MNSHARALSGKTLTEAGDQQIGGHGRRVEIPLRPVAPKEAQRLELLFGLDPDGHHQQPQVVGQFDRGPDDRGVVFVDAEPGYQRLVDLHEVQRESFEIAERGLTRPEIVQPDPYTERPEEGDGGVDGGLRADCLLYTSPSPRDS